MKRNASPNPSFNDYFLQKIVTDLNLPKYTGDFSGSKVYGRAELEKLRDKLNKKYGILLDTISLVNKPDNNWCWQEFNSLVPPDKLINWQQKWGNPGAWYKPISLVEFQKHAVILYLIYQLYYYSQAQEIDKMVFFYGLLLRNPDFEKPTVHHGVQRDFYQERIYRFKVEGKHREARINDLIGLIVDHEVQSLKPAYNTKYGFSLRIASLLPIIYYQMGVLIRFPSDDFTKIRKCANCNSYFWGHGNRRYCYKNSCDRRVVYKNKKREEIKNRKLRG